MIWGHFCAPAALPFLKKGQTRKSISSSKMHAGNLHPSCSSVWWGEWLKFSSVIEEGRPFTWRQVHWPPEPPYLLLLGVVYCFGLVPIPGSVTLLAFFYLFGNPNDTTKVSKSRDCWAFPMCVRPVLRALYLSPLYLYSNGTAGVPLSPFKEIRGPKNKG